MPIERRVRKIGAPTLVVPLNIIRSQLESARGWKTGRTEKGKRSRERWETLHCQDSRITELAWKEGVVLSDTEVELKPRSRIQSVRREVLENDANKRTVTQ